MEIIVILFAMKYAIAFPSPIYLRIDNTMIVFAPTTPTRFLYFVSVAPLPIPQ